MIKLLFILLLTPTPREVYDECVFVGMQHPLIVTKQFILETGWGKDIEGNNLFGLYDSGKKKLRIYTHWRESVRAYKELIQDPYYHGGDYYAFLECMWKGTTGKCKRYAGDQRYIWKLQHIRLSFVDHHSGKVSPRRGRLYRRLRQIYYFTIEKLCRLWSFFF